MATVLTIFGLRVYLKDHRQAHVHVFGNGVEAVFKLNCPGGPPELGRNNGLPKKQLAKIKVALRSHLNRRVHGYF